MKAGVLGSSAKLTGRFGRSEGPRGYVVLVPATYGAQGHAESLSGAGVERRQLRCSSTAAALQIDANPSTCTDAFQPSLFALQQVVATTPPLPGARPGASQAMQRSWAQLPTSASASRHQPLVRPPGSLPALLQIPNPRTQHLCPALIYFFNKVKNPGVCSASASPGTALSSLTPKHLA